MIQPIRDNILVKPLSKDNISESGLIIPESCAKVSNRMVVVAVGNGTKQSPMKRQVGDIGYRVKLWGEEIIIDGEPYFLMNQSALIAIE